LHKHSIVKSRAVSLLLRVVAGLFLAALIGYIFYLYDQQGWKEIITFYRYLLNPKRLRLFIESFGPFAAVVFVLIQALQVVFAPVPGEVTGFVGGYLFGNLMGTILSTIGLTLGSVGAFYFARIFGLKVVEKVVKKEYITKFNDFITHKGLYISYILFLIPGFPKDSLCYLLGLSHMRFLDFFLMNLLGRLPGTVILTFQGTAVKDARYKSFLYLLIGSAAMTLTLYFTRNYLITYFTHIVHKLKGKKKDKPRQGHPVTGKKIK
jgi:uncharacterized membrane protein YdjX (TVP38/TMEM64 family)